MELAVEPVKVCPRCRSAKPLTEFYRSKRAKDGASSYCKDCVKARNAEYHSRGRKPPNAVAKAIRESREVTGSTAVGTVNRNIAPSLDDFVAFASNLVTEFGAPLTIEPFQRVMLQDYFDGVTETVIILPKKNGKTTLLGALAIYHLARVRDAECVIGAASRDQATILFNQAAGLVRRSAIAHEFDIRTGYREIRLAGEKMGARVRVLAADAATADGVIPTLALVDELHRHPSSALYGVFRDGLGPRDGQMVTISTAGATQKSPLGEVRALARAMDGFTREGAHQYVKSPDGGFVLHEWSLEDEAEADDIEKVKGANPAPWQTVEALRQRFESPSTSKWQWFRFACGIWTEGEEPWLDPAKWDSLTDLSAEGTSESIVGVRVGHKHLTAALVLASRAGLGRWKIEAEIFDKLGEEDAPLAFLEDRIRELCDQRPISTVVYWSSAFQRSADLLEADGVPILEIPFRPNRVMDASETLLKVIEERRIAHDGDRGLRSSVLSGKVKMTEGGWRFVDNPEGSSPDALLAMAAAVHIGETQYTGDPQVAVL